MKKVLTFVLVAVLCLLLCACSSQVKQIVASETNIEMVVGDSRTVDISAEPAKAVLSKLTWSSSNTNIVTVEDGTVRALSAGTAVVTVKTENGVSKSFNITVKDKEITAISLDKASTKIKVGSTVQIEADVTPVDAPTGGLKWSSSDNDVATVNSDGYVTGVSKGVANIICKSSNDIEASCTVTVEASSDKSSENNADANTVINNYYSYGHYHPDYVYSASDFVFPESSSRKLTRSEISATLSYMSGYSPAGNYAQDAINEIYARNGYVFKTSNIRAYYESKPWYYADSTFTISDFSSIEKYNIALLEEFD